MLTDVSLPRMTWFPTLWFHVNCSSHLTRPPVYATLLWSDQSKSLEVLIDSGANVSLMDVTLVSELGIPIQPSSIPMGGVIL